MSARSSFPAQHRLDRSFFLIFAVVAVVAVAGGFLPRLSTIFSGERDWPPFIVHVHATLFYGWIALLVTQTLLIRKRQAGLHKRLGVGGLMLAALMVVVGVGMALHMAGWHLVRGSDRALNFLPVPLGDMAVFAGLMAAAAWKRKDGPAHKRLVLLATTQLLGAGFGRMDLYQVPATPALPALQPFIALYGMLWLIMAAAVAFDLITRRRVHPVYVVAIPYMLAIQFAASSLTVWSGWPTLARGSLALA